MTHCQYWYVPFSLLINIMMRYEPKSISNNLYFPMCSFLYPIFLIHFQSTTYQEFFPFPHLKKKSKLNTVSSFAGFSVF